MLVPKVIGEATEGPPQQTRKEEPNAMFTIHAYIALTALGCLVFRQLAVRGARRDTPPAPPAVRLPEAA
jgi:hypothetical protein